MALDPASFRDRITEALTLAGLSRGDLAEKLGITEQTVHYWFSKKRLPDGPTMLRLPAALGVSVAWLFGEDLDTASARTGALRALEEVEGRIQDMKDRLRADGEAIAATPATPPAVADPGSEAAVLEAQRRASKLGPIPVQDHTPQPGRARRADGQG